MNRKVISMILIFALFIPCLIINQYHAAAAITSYLNENFDGTDPLSKYMINAVEHGSVTLGNIGGSSNAAKISFSASPSSNDTRTATFTANLATPVSLANKKVVLEAKVYQTDTGGVRTLFDYSDQTAGDSYTDALVKFDSTNIKAGGATGSETTQGTFAKDKWYHVIVIIDSTGASRTYDLYIDGVKLNTNPIAWTSTFANMNSIARIRWGYRSWAAQSAYYDDLKIFEFPSGLELENSSTITNGKQDVSPLTREMVLDFDTVLTAAPSDVKLTYGSDQNVDITYSLDSFDKSKLKVTVNESLNPNVDYTLSFTGLTDIFGNNLSEILFKTSDPMVLMTSTPADGATNVDVRTNIILNFDNPIDPSTFSVNEIAIRGGTSQIDDVILSNGDKTAEITFNGRFAYSTAYTVTLSNNIRSTPDTGSMRISNRVFTFTTSAMLIPDTFVDELENTDKMYYFSNTEGAPHFYFDKSSPEEHGNDTSRIALGKNAAGSHIIYKMDDDIRSFKVNKLVGNSQRPNNEATLKMYVSKTGENGSWADITPPEQTVSISSVASYLTAYKHEKTTGIPSGMKYLKIEFASRASAAVDFSIWSPKITRIEINQTLPSAPYIVSSNPADGDDNAPVSNTIRINFSYYMDTTTLIPANFNIASETDKNITVTGVNADNGKQVTLTFNKNLAFDTAYVLTVSDRVLDVVEQPIAPDGNAIEFTTAYALSFDAPIVTIGGNPANNKLTAGQLSVSVSVTNNDTKPVSAVLVVAYYEGDTLLAVDFDRNPSISNTDTLVVNTINITSAGANNYVKAFLRKNVDTSQPLSDILLQLRP